MVVPKRGVLVGAMAVCLLGALMAAGCGDACDSLREEACVVQETGAPECDRQPGSSAGSAGPREPLCERSLILYRSNLRD